MTPDKPYKVVPYEPDVADVIDRATGEKVGYVLKWSTGWVGYWPDHTGTSRTTVYHILKCDSPFWGDVARGDKTFEIRKNDRNFRLGDTLCLRDWLPDRGLYRHEVTGKQESIVHARVGYICYSGMSGWFGLEPGYVAMGLTDVRIALNHGPGTNDGSDA
jgi:hypothetical protein